MFTLCQENAHKLDLIKAAPAASWLAERGPVLGILLSMDGGGGAGVEGVQSVGSAFCFPQQPGLPQEHL